MIKVTEVRTSEGKIRYMVINGKGDPIPEVLRYLKYKDASGAARNTLRTYSYHLKLYYEFLYDRQIMYEEVRLDDIASFLQWLKDPWKHGKVQSIEPMVRKSRSARTINAIINTVLTFYDYLFRQHGLTNQLVAQVTRHARSSTRPFKDLLHHIRADQTYIQNMLKLPIPKAKPKTLPKQDIQSLMEHCPNLRDRFLIQLLWESSMRIGEALSLWLEDVEIDGRKIHIRDRGELENLAEIKTVGSPRTIDVSEELINQYLEYIAVIHTEKVHTNFVFIKLSGSHRYDPLEYHDIVSLFQRLRNKTGIYCTAHMLRHTSLTTLRRAGWKDEHLMKRAGHAHVQTTLQMYVHPDEEDIRKDWEKAEATMRLSHKDRRT